MDKRERDFHCLGWPVNGKTMSQTGDGEVEYDDNENQVLQHISSTSTSCGARRNPDERQVHSFIVVPAKSSTSLNAVMNEFRFISPIIFNI